jgi:hypothetical protein
MVTVICFTQVFATTTRSVILLFLNTNGFQAAMISEAHKILQATQTGSRDSAILMD